MLSQKDKVATVKPLKFFILGKTMLKHAPKPLSNPHQYWAASYQVVLLVFWFNLEKTTKL